MAVLPSPRARLRLESLESRELPSATPLAPLPAAAGIVRQAADGPSSMNFDGPNGVKLVSGLILTKYLDFQAADGILGRPTSDQADAGNGVFYQLFENGAIGINPKVGAVELHGPILEKYEKMGSINGILGLPTTDVIDYLGDGRMYAKFDGGLIAFTPANTLSAVEIHGEIYQKYLSMGGPSTSNPLGLPGTDVITDIPDGLPLKAVTLFEHGVIAVIPGTGTVEMHGDIWDKYYNSGGIEQLGMPLTDVRDLGNGVQATFFKDGAIGTIPAHGTVEIYGPIYERYISLGADFSKLGYPTSDVRATADGKGLVVSFEHGYIYYYADKGTTIATF